MEGTTGLEAETLSAHVAACAVRYKSVRDRMQRMEWALYVLVGLVIANSDLSELKSIFSLLRS